MTNPKAAKIANIFVTSKFLQKKSAMIILKNNSITSDFWIISRVVLQIFCIFLVSLSTFYYLCGINTFIYVRENIKIAGN